MVRLNLDTPDPTLEAMRKAMEVKAMREPRRGYLGASLIGNECVRQVYYNYNGYPKEPFKSPTLMAFESGHRAEDLTADRLRMVKGLKLHTHRPDGSQWGFKEEYKLDSPIDIIDPKTGEVTGIQTHGVFAGHIDGVIEGLLQAPKNPHIWEHKDCNEKKFKQFEQLKMAHGEKDVLYHWNMNYYVQHQIYMHKFGMDRGYMTVSLAGCRDYSSCRTEYKPEWYAQYRERAEKIIKANNPPPKISSDKNFWLCRFCDYNETCHG